MQAVEFWAVPLDCDTEAELFENLDSVLLRAVLDFAQAHDSYSHYALLHFFAQPDRTLESLQAYIDNYHFVMSVANDLQLKVEQIDLLLGDLELAAIIQAFLAEHQDIEADKSAGAILRAITEGVFYGPYDETEREDIIENIWHLDPILYAQFLTHVVIDGQKWVKDHPGEVCGFGCKAEIALKAYWKTLSGYTHTALDICGLFPGAGEPCDGVNGMLYLIEGDGVNAGLSFGAMIPFAGWAATGAKWAGIILTLPSGVKKTLKITKQSNGLVKFSHSSSTQFREILGITSSNVQAHHIFPKEFWDHPAVQLAAQAPNNTFHMNHFLNGVPLDIARHNGYHPNYSSQVRDFLDGIDLSLTPDQIGNLIRSKQSQWKDLIESSTDHIEDVFLP